MQAHHGRVLLSRQRAGSAALRLRAHAVKSAVAATFLDANRAAYKAGALGGKAMDPPISPTQRGR